MKCDQDGWIGRPPSWSHVVVILVTSAVAIAVSTSLQPILLGGMVAEKRLTLTQLGQTATAELISMAVMCSIAGAFFKAGRLRLKAAVAGLGLIAANVLTMVSSSGEVLLARALSGACYGIYMWILTLMLVRSHNAARYAGIFTATQGVVSVVLSYVFATLAISRLGINGGYACLALVSAVMVTVSRLFPVSFDPLPAGNADRIPPPRGLVGLLTIFLYLAGLIGIWIYVGEMSRQSGHTPQQTSIAVSIAIAAQVFGALLAVALGNRLKPLIAITVGGLGSFALAAAITSELSIVQFTTAGALFGMLWMFSTSFLIPLIVEADSTRTAAMYSSPVQMLGAASGPAFGAFLVHGGDVRHAIFGSGILLVVAVAIAIVNQSTLRNAGVQMRTIDAPHSEKPTMKESI